MFNIELSREFSILDELSKNPEKVNSLIDHITCAFEKILDKNGNEVINEALTRLPEGYDQYRPEIFTIFNDPKYSYIWFIKVLDIIKRDIEKNGEKVKRSFNVLPNVILKDNFLEDMRDFLDNTSNHKTFIIELLEYKLGENQRETGKILETLRTLQVDIPSLKLQYDIAIDDIYFGGKVKSQGLINLEILLAHHIIPNYVKIEGKNFEELYKSKDQKLIQLYIQELKKIKQYGCIIIAEWIKDKEEVDFAISLGVDLFQGRDLKPEHFKDN